MLPKDLIGMELRVVDIGDDGSILVQEVIGGQAHDYIILKVHPDEQFGPFFHPVKLVEDKVA